VALIAAIVAGGILLLPSLTLLFRLALGGRLGHGARGGEEAVLPRTPRGLLPASAGGLVARGAVASLAAGIGLLTIADAGWAHAAGVVALFAFVVLGFLATAPALLDATATGSTDRR
jgi:cytochrome d ubiquinol oxidase subunit II